MVEFPLIMEVRLKVRVSSGDSLNKNIPRKKKFDCLKQVRLKRISHQDMFRTMLSMLSEQSKQCYNCHMQNTISRIYL